MKIIFIALVIALTSSSLLVQEQAGPIVPESQKRDITIPSANGDPIRISYGGNADSVNVDGNQISDKQNVISTPNVSRHLENETDEAVMDIAPEEIAESKDIIEMTEDDVATEKQAEIAETILTDDKATVIQRANAILILLTPTKSEADEMNDQSNPDDDQVILTRAQANDIKAVIALLVANIPDERLDDVQDTVALDQTPEDPDDQTKTLRSRRAKALRRVSKLRAVRRRRHRAMSTRSYTTTRNHQIASNFRRRRVLHLSPPHFVRYNTAAHNRHLIGTPVPKIEAQATAPVTENKEVV